MSTQPLNNLTPKQYVALERRSDEKHEYFAGEVFAMGGASRNHNRITVNLSSLLHRALASRPCEVFASDMRVKVLGTGLYTYPNVAVVCNRPQFEDSESDTLLNPELIIEVLSDSTEKYDRGKKFEHYRLIESVLSYTLVSQHRPLIEHFARHDNQQWLLTVAEGLDSQIEFARIGCRLDLADIYARVEFPDASGTLR